MSPCNRMPPSRSRALMEMGLIGRFVARWAGLARATRPPRKTSTCVAEAQFLSRIHLPRIYHRLSQIRWLCSHATHFHVSISFFLVSDASLLQNVLRRGSTANAFFRYLSCHSFLYQHNATTTTRNTEDGVYDCGSGR